MKRKKLKRWLKYVKPYWIYFALTPVFIMIEVVGEVIMPRLLASLINSANAGTLTNGESIRVMIKMAITAIFMMGGGILGAYSGNKASVNFGADLRSDLFSKVQRFSFANVDKFSTGSLVTRLTNDVTRVQNFVGMVIRMALRAPGMMIAALVMAITIRPSLSLVFLVSVPLLMLCISAITRTAFPRFGIMQSKVDALNSTVQENVTNVRVVKSFVREKFSIGKFREANTNLKQASLNAVMVIIFMSPVMTFFMNATIIAVILIGGPIVLKGEMAVGDLSAFITYVTQILMSLMMINFILMQASRAIASGNRIAEVLDEQPDITDETAACKEKTVEHGSIEFRNVTFRYYKNSEETVLNDVSLTIPEKSTVGIIGSTGSGKTTLVSMIPRLYDCDSGEVLVDGVNVKDYSLFNLREGVGMGLQNNLLFSGTIADNLRWGDEDATDEELKQAAAAAQADGFVTGFTDGYDTKIDQGGTNVSGGQKQRLCIARALLKKPKILILDDSTSAVDTATEALIRESFANELKDSTKIIIAQRISSVQEADMIVVLNEGRITGIGKHEDLLESSEEYREIYESQSGMKKGA